MLAQYLPWLDAINLKKSNKNVLGLSMLFRLAETDFHIYFCVERFYIIFQKCTLRQGFWLSFVLNLFLLFHNIVQQISGSRSYRLVLIQKGEYYAF